MNIFIDENIPYLNKVLEGCGNITLFKGRDLTNHDLIAGGCDCLFVRSTTKVNQDLLEGTVVKFVGTATSGIDHIDTDYIQSKSIGFASAMGSNSNSVAEYVVFSILMWASVNNLDLKNLNIGIIGYGNIGRLVAKYANKLGMNIIVNDPPLRKENFNFPDFVQYSELEELCSNSNIITNHVPLTFNGEFPTYKLINSDVLQLMQNRSLLIHTSRGGVIDEGALIEFLKSRRLYAVIDVWEDEPFINDELGKLSFMATPHIAGYSYNGKLNGCRMMADAIKNFFNIEPNYQIINDLIKPQTHGETEIFTNKIKLMNLLKESRQLDKDYIGFLKILLLNREERALAFDNLRKNYPARWEILI